MAETRIIGAVAVKVRPETKGFRRKTKAGILKELRDMDVNVEVKIDADLDGLKRKLRDLDGQTVTAKVEVETDVDKVAKEVDKTLGDLEKKQSKRTIKFNADRESIKKAISEVQKELDKLTAESLKVELNKDGLYSALDELEKRLADQPLKLRYSNDREGLKAAVAQIDAELAKLREVELSVYVDEDDLRRARERLLDEIGTEPVTLKVDYGDLTSLREAKKRLDAELKELSKVEVEVAADEESLHEFSKKIEDLIEKAERDEVNLSVNAFTADAAAVLKYASRTRFVDFIVRVNKRSLLVAEGVLKSLAGWNVISDTGRALEDLITSFDKITVKGGLWSAAIGGIADSFSYLLTSALTVGDGILESVGTLAMLPALLSTMAAVVAINVAAWKDFGDAVNGNNKALAKLPPNAQKAARSLRGAWTAIQKPVQRKFWQGMGDELSKLARVIIPQFRDGLSATAEHVGRFGAGVAKSFRKIALSGDLKKMFVGLEGFFDNLAGAAEPFVDALNTLGLRGSEHLPRFGEWLTELAVRFDNFIQKADDAGDINRWIEDGIKSMKDMGRVISGTIDVFQGLTKAAYDAGMGGLSDFADTMQRIGNIVDSEPFRSRMSRIFLGANSGATKLNKGVKDLGSTFMNSADNVGTLLESLGELGGVTLSGLSKSFANLKFQNGLQDAIDGLIVGIKDMGPAFESVGTIVGHFGSLAGEVFKGLAPILNDLTGMFADVISVIGPELEKLAPTLSQTLGGALGLIQPLLVNITDSLSNMLEAFNGLPKPIQSAVIVLGALSVGAVSTGRAIFNMIPAIQTAMGRFDVFAGRMPKTASALGKVAKAGGIAAGALLGLQAIGAIISVEQRTSTEQFANAINKVTEAAAKGAPSLQGLNDAFSTWDTVMGDDRSGGIRDIASAIEEVANPSFMDGVNKNFNGLNQFFNLPDDKITMLEKRFAGLGDELGNLVRNGNGPKAAQVFAQLASEFEKQGKSAQDALNIMPGYADSLRAMASDAGVAVNDTDLLAWALSGIPPAAVDAAQGADRIRDSMADIGLAADGTIDDLKRFTDALFDAGLKTMDSRDAAFAYEEQITAIGDAVKRINTGELGKALNQAGTDFEKTTEAGRLANAEFQRLARDGMASVTAAANEGLGQDELQARLQKTYTDLIAAGEGFGMSTEHASALTREIMGIPPGVDIKTWMDTFAREEAGRIKAEVETIPGYKKVTVAVAENGTTGEVQSKINKVTGKEEYIFVTEGGTTAKVQKQIISIDGVTREVYVTDDGTIVGTQKNINAVRGKEVDVTAKYGTRNYSDSKNKFDSIKAKAPLITAAFTTAGYGGVKRAWDSIRSKTVSVISKFFGSNGMNGGITGSSSLGLASGIPNSRAFKQFANGGIENHTAQIAYSTKSTPVRIWAEPETGGEAYIPLSPSKRARSLAIWRETGKRLGADFYAEGGVTGGASGSGSAPTFNITNHYPVAEKTSVTVNRAMQYASIPGLTEK